MNGPDDGWITWEGGECPVEPETVVDYLNFGETPDNYVSDRLPAKHLRWSWIFDGSGGDIIAYRVVQS